LVGRTIVQSSATVIGRRLKLFDDRTDPQTRLTGAKMPKKKESYLILQVNSYNIQLIIGSVHKFNKFKKVFEIFLKLYSEIIL
jgi:hypothetical protein